MSWPCNDEAAVKKERDAVVAFILRLGRETVYLDPSDLADRIEAGEHL